MESRDESDGKIIRGILVFISFLIWYFNDDNIDRFILPYLFLITFFLIAGFLIVSDYDEISEKNTSVLNQKPVPLAPLSIAGGIVTIIFWFLHQLPALLWGIGFVIAIFMRIDKNNKLLWDTYNNK